MGIYKSYTTYNGYPAYHGTGENRLYYTPNGWLVGSKLGSPTGYIHNAAHDQCPYMIVSQPWMYFFNGMWYNDQTLVVRCIA